MNGERGQHARTLPFPEIPSHQERRKRLLKCRLESLGLTRQECCITLLLLEDADVCRTLYITKNTLKFHIRNLNRKLGLRNRKDLPALAGRLLSPAAEEPFHKGTGGLILNFAEASVLRQTYSEGES